MYSVSCDPMCGYMVKSHDPEETVNMAFTHVSNKHKDKNLTRDQVKGTMKTE
jgi:predicted small metal-binding protein